MDLVDQIIKEACQIRDPGEREFLEKNLNTLTVEQCIKGKAYVAARIIKLRNDLAKQSITEDMGR